MKTHENLRVFRSTSGASRWEMAEREPCALLRPFVRKLVGYDECALCPQHRRQFPSPFVVAIIEFGPPTRVRLGGNDCSSARHSGGYVAGLGDQYAITEHAGRQRGVQVDLTPTGARRLLQMPLREVAGRVVALRDIMPAAYATLQERLHAACDWVTRLDLIEDFLVQRIHSANIDTARVDWAVARIEARGGLVEVGSLARELGYSHKHLIALFHDQVGVPPKLFARLVRFAAMIDEVHRVLPNHWAELALAHGYFDQAHLAREVKRLTGLTPTEVAEGQNEAVALFR